MDAAGAESLRWRIEQQQHWRLAEAVVDGRQSAIDPDSEDLVSIGDGIRIYSARHTREGLVHLCKRLVNGVWEHGTIDEPIIDGAPVAPKPLAVARVA